MKIEQLQPDLKATKIKKEKQYKLVTFPLNKPEYFELRIDAMKREVPIPKVVIEIFMLGWERYQQQKQSA